jgi:sulfate/thiosulfate-binding protein
MRTRLLLAVALLGVAAVTAAAASARPAGVTLNLVAYSTPRGAFAKLIPAFQATRDGKGVDFTQSYGASGDQARAIVAGLKADVVMLSLAPDVDALVKQGLVDAKWNRQSYRGMVTDSVVCFVLRDGNPKKLRTWDDLLKPGVQVITPNPFTSGGARWNVMAAYGAWLKQGLKPKQAQAKLLSLFRNVAVQDKSARDALNTFLAGKGDVRSPTRTRRSRRGSPARRSST